ncbi:MAG: hypothetical protein HKM88_01575 [Halobacteria archaeon]|nr:hypothetical protein [Halobacteria archaeon]
MPVSKMEEQEYKATYHAINQRRCVFEKAINARRCACEQSARFCLADREGVACKSDAGNEMCTELLNTLRRNARFTLHLMYADGPLPHAKEIRVQAGGLQGLQQLIDPDSDAPDSVDNIYALTKAVFARYEGLQDLPLDRIMQAIVSFQGRRKSSRPLKPSS